MGKIIALTRISTAQQQIESQSDKVIQRILQDGYSKEDIIEIRGVESASKLSENERLTLNEMKHTIETEHVEAVYVFEISRIARKTSILFSIRDYLQEHHVQLVCMDPPLTMFNSDWSISTSAAMLFSVFSTLSEQETYLRVERTMRGKLKKASEGKLTSGRPLYGYSTLKDKTIIINEQQATIIHEIYDRFQSGETSGSIAKDLYLTGLLKTNRLTTARCYVSDILREKRYTGITPYPQIINPVQFDTCREICQKSSAKFGRKRYTDKDFVCQGLLYTTQGYALTASYSNNRYGKMNDSERLSLSINMKVTDTLSTYVLKEYLKSGPWMQSKEAEYDIIYKRRERLSQEGRGIDKRLLEIEEENSRINNRIIKGRMLESDGDKMIDANILESKKLLDKKSSLEYEILSLTNHMNYINSFLYEMDLPPLETSKQIELEMKKHVSKIIVSKLGFGHFNLEYHFKNGLSQSYQFKSTNHGIKFWNDKGQEIPLEMKQSRG